MTTNPLDQIEAITAARTAAMNLLPAPPAGQAAIESNFARTLAERLAAGETVGEDVIHEYLELRRADEDRSRAASMVRMVINHLKDMADNAQRAAVPHRLTQLRPELAAVVDEARTLLKRLGSVRTAEHAITHGVADAWGRMHELGNEYARLRNQQATLTGEAVGDGHVGRSRVRRYGILANVREVWPDAVKFDANERGEPAPWPHEPGRPYEADQGRDFLIWLAETPDAQPWVPSVQQLGQAEQAARDAMFEHHVRQGVAKTGDNDHPAEYRSWRA